MKKISTELEKIVYDEPTFADAVDTLINDIKRQSANAIKILRERFKDETTPSQASTALMVSAIAVKSRP